MSPCARPGCKGDGKPTYCSAKCASRKGWNAPNGHGRQVKAKAAQPATASWWLSGDFYANARKRFPLDAFDANRSKVYTHGTESAGFNSRAKSARQREGRTA